MGRKKNSKKRLSDRNRQAISLRLKDTCDNGNRAPVEPRPNLQTCDPQPSVSMLHVTNAPFVQQQVSEETVENVSRPTGFALYSSYNEIIPEKNESAEYILVETKKLESFIGSFPCKMCFSESSKVITKCIKGFAVTLNVKCDDCDYETSFCTSQSTNTNDTPRGSYDVNRRVVKAIASIGKGHRALDMFCMSLNMSPMNYRTFQKHISSLHASSKTEMEHVLELARCEVKKCYVNLDADNEVFDKTVSYDGSWQKRGFTSKYGIGCCIEILTGLVIDFEVMSNFSNICEVTVAKRKISNAEHFQTWYNNHKGVCNQNYVGSSPGMEVDAAERLWRRSESIGFRYTTMLSDGDAKTIAHLNDCNIYGDKKIEKVECLNHVAKRLGTGLRKLVKDRSKSKNPVGGRSRGHLSEPVIQKLTRYYHNGIHKNLGNVTKMKEAIYVTLFHCKSTDESPHHKLCPLGKESWCSII